jgi:hypothetical protein
MAYKRKSEEFHTRLEQIVADKTTGATSSKMDFDMHDLPYEALRMAATRFAYGRGRHGRFNWRRGKQEFAEERLKHLVNHVMLFAAERQQVDLEALLCNAMMIAWYYDNGIMSKDPVKDFMEQGKQEKK